MTWFGAILLGLLQGITEFLPVSSSGHLALFQQVIDAGEAPLMLDLVLHLGTLIPAIWFFRVRLRAMFSGVFVGDGPMLERANVRLGLLVVLATLTTAIAGLPFKDVLEARFEDPNAVGVEFLISAAILAATAYRDGGSEEIAAFKWYHAVLLGLAQAVAIAPGISRSGTTIAVALFLGFRRAAAVEFSFLMMIPAILGATVLEAGDVDLVHFAWGPALAGAVVAAVAGYMALAGLVAIVQRGGLYRFSIYLVFMAMVAFALGAT